MVDYFRTASARAGSAANKALRSSAIVGCVRMASRLHVLRHSMIFCMSAAGVDRRIIDEIVGHCQEEMRRRYRHPTTEVKKRSVDAVFG
jgi:integrase